MSDLEHDEIPFDDVEAGFAYFKRHYLAGVWNPDKAEILLMSMSDPSPLQDRIESFLDQQKQ